MMFIEIYTLGSNFFLEPIGFSFIPIKIVKQMRVFLLWSYNLYYKKKNANKNCNL